MENRVATMVGSPTGTAESLSVEVAFRDPASIRELLRERVSKSKGRSERWADSNEGRLNASLPQPPPYVGIFQWKWNDTNPSNEWSFSTSNLLLEVDGRRMPVYDWSNFQGLFPAARYDTENWGLLFGSEARRIAGERWILTEAWPLSAVRSRWTWDPAFKIAAGNTNAVRLEMELTHAWKRASGTNRVKGG